MKFQKGDSVRLHKPILNVTPNWISKMDKNDGKIVTLKEISPTGMYWIIDGFNYREDWMELVKGAEMQKKDLKDGDVVEFRSGRRAVVFKGTFMISPYVNHDMDTWTDDLINTGFVGRDLDVVKIRKHPWYPIEMLDTEAVFTHDIGWDWECREIKEVTMAEVEEKFGCKVKIIKGDNE